MNEIDIRKKIKYYIELRTYVIDITRLLQFIYRNILKIDDFEVANLRNRTLEIMDNKIAELQSKIDNKN